MDHSPSSGSIRLHSIENRKLSKPSSAHNATSSGHRFHESQPSPLDSTHPDPGVCSHCHQSLFQLPPSIWCAAVAVPQRNPSGNEVDMGVTLRDRPLGQTWRMPQAEVDNLVALLDLEP